MPGEQMGNLLLDLLRHQSPRRHAQARRHDQHAHRSGIQQLSQCLYIRVAAALGRHVQHPHARTLQGAQQAPAAGGVHQRRGTVQRQRAQQCFQQRLHIGPQVDIFGTPVLLRRPRVALGQCTA
ncbi:hypothetical protein D3C71_1753770 [compost metagenome]